VTWLATGMIVASVALAAGAWFGFQIVRQHGRILLRLEALEGADTGPDGIRAYRGNRRLTDSRIRRDGLVVGTVAPAFRLRRVGGGELSLGEFFGRRILLVFSDLACGPCMLLAPDLERLHRRSATPQVLVISRGEAEENRTKAAEHGLTYPIVIQRRWDLSRDYGMFATPIAYLIDEKGVIAANVAVGRDAILALASLESSEAEGREAHG
jgi:peroxiredoxin